MQQYLPFTVLKLTCMLLDYPLLPSQLQQYLPFTVLKPINIFSILMEVIVCVATVLTVYGIETLR